MLIGGEKYACEACVRGHRVSNCQHSDRPLTHIAKKGRPVSQCAHCRTLRKSRSAHVKCDCGEKMHAKGACIHLKDADKDSCTCNHGGRCSCSLKKDHLDPVPESDSDDASPVAVCNEKPLRPRAQTSQSDHGLTIFTNGHHKPPHKHNQMAHKCGLPYVVPRAHSIHGPSPSGLANRSVDNLPHTNTIDALHSESHIKDSMISAQQEQRLIKSEHGSPHLSASCDPDQSNRQMTPLDLSALEDFTTEYNLTPFEAFTPIDEPAIFSAGLTSASIDWSLYDGLDFNNDDFATSSYSQAQSFTGIDFSSIDQPTLTTTSTSGEVSEVEDFGSIPDSGAVRPIVTQQFGSDASDLGDHDGYLLSTRSSYIGLSQAHLQANTNSNMGYLNMEEYLKTVDTNNHSPPTNHGLNIDEFVNEAEFLRDQTPNDLGFQLPINAEDNDGGEEALWMNDFTTHGNANTQVNGSSNPDDDKTWAQ